MKLLIFVHHSASNWNVERKPIRSSSTNDVTFTPIGHVVAPISSRRDLDDSCSYLKAVRNNKFFNFYTNKMALITTFFFLTKKKKKNWLLHEGRRVRRAQRNRSDARKKQKHFVPVRWSKGKKWSRIKQKKKWNNDNDQHFHLTATRQRPSRLLQSIFRIFCKKLINSFSS